jgi:ATP-dependent helicase/nuclease subunit A
MLEQVKASAGSGKTYALTAAFLGFLANAQKNGAPACGFFTPAALLDDNQEDDRPEEYGPEGYGWTDILAMTFTNKAAAEMKGRVLDALKKIALADPKAPEAPGWTQAKAADWVETLIRRFGRLNIRTIDSLLHLLLQQSALGLDLPPDFEPVFKVEAIVEPIYDALVARAEAEDGPERRAIQAVGDALLARSGKLGFLARAQLKERLVNVIALRIATPGVFFTDAALLGQTISGLEDAHRASLNALAAIAVGGLAAGIAVSSPSFRPAVGAAA